MTVAIKHGRKCKVEAVSGQETFDKRSNVISMLGDLATAAVATGEPVWYMGDTSDMAPQVEQTVQAYVDESHSKTVAVMPLLRKPLEAPNRGAASFASSRPVNWALSPSKWPPSCFAGRFKRLATRSYTPSNSPPIPTGQLIGDGVEGGAASRSAEGNVGELSTAAGKPMPKRPPKG